MTALSAILLTGVPAHADSQTSRDPKGDTDGGASSNDIVSTTVINAANIGVTIRHRDLQRSARDIQFEVHAADGAQTTVFGTFGSGEVLVFDENFAPLPCSGATVSRSLAKDVSKLMVPRECLAGDTTKVKLRPRVQWNSSGSKGDYSFNGSDHLSPWVRR